MSIYKTALMVVGTTALMACAAPEAQTPKNEVQSSYTPKPGASVQFSSQVPGKMDVGRFHAIELEFTETYQDDDLSVSLTASEGLNLFGGIDVKVFDMKQGPVHEWDVDVSADTDGIYYLDVFVEAQGEPRVFSVKLEIGDVDSDMRDSAKTSSGKIVDGVRVLEAEETIK